MRMNHPETIPPNPWSMEKLSSTKPVSGAKKVGDRCIWDSLDTRMASQWPVEALGEWDF